MSQLLFLPVQLGCLWVKNLTTITEKEFENLKKVTSNLISAIQHDQQDNPKDLEELSRVCKLQLRLEGRARQLEFSEALRTVMDDAPRQVNKIACKSGSPNWLTSLPLKDLGHVLTKQKFWYALNLGFNLPHPCILSKCVYGAKIDLNHAFLCKNVWFVSSRHNDLRNITVKARGG